MVSSAASSWHNSLSASARPPAWLFCTTTLSSAFQLIPRYGIQQTAPCAAVSVSRPSAASGPASGPSSFVAMSALVFLRLRGQEGGVEGGCRDGWGGGVAGAEMGGGGEWGVGGWVGRVRAG